MTHTGRNNIIVCMLFTACLFTCNMLPKEEKLQTKSTHDFDPYSGFDSALNGAYIQGDVNYNKIQSEIKKASQERRTIIYSHPAHDTVRVTPHPFK